MRSDKLGLICNSSTNKTRPNGRSILACLILVLNNISRSVLINRTLSLPLVGVGSMQCEQVKVVQYYSTSEEI